MAQNEQQNLVSAAETTFSNFMSDPEMSWLQQNLPRARAVLIAPQVVKAGYIFGGSGGRAVLIARDPRTGVWTGPAFYSLATASVGFQAGLSVSESVSLIMTERGLDSLLADSFKLGGDASVAAGPVGAGAKADLMADIVSFSRSKGLYGGLSLVGTIVSPDNGWNEAYYRGLSYENRPIYPADIIVRGGLHNTQADPLVAEIATEAIDTAAAAHG